MPCSTRWANCSRRKSGVMLFPKMEMDEHRADRRQIEQRIAELEKQLADHAKKSGEGKAGA
jgi:hypothetical protein